MDLVIVSIGALAKNPLWNERTPVRSSHATTTLLRSTAAEKDPAPRVILVDPSLPAQLLVPRLEERTGLQPGAVTHVFLTNWRPVHRRALDAFSHATWWMHEREIDAAADALDRAADSARRQDAAAESLIQKERDLLARVQPAPDDIAAGIDLYPLPGYTPGQCGLLVSDPARTTLIAGDAVPTAAHFLAGQVFPDSFDLAQAKESLVEIYEIADLIVPGHDNLFPAPRAAGL